MECDEKLKLDYLLLSMSEARILDDTEIYVVLSFTFLINSILDKNFSGEYREVANAGLRLFIENLNANLKINTLIKSGVSASTLSPIVCMSIHNNPAAQDFLLKNLDVLARSGYGHVLVEHREDTLKLARRTAHLRRKDPLFARMAKIYELKPSEEFHKLQEFFTSPVLPRSSLLSHEMFEPTLLEGFDDGFGMQELYVSSEKDFLLWERVNTNPDLQLCFAEHYSHPGEYSKAIAHAGANNAHIFNLRNIGFVLELVLASFTGGDETGKGALLLIGAAHADGISKLYKTMFSHMPQPQFVHPCVLSPDYSNSFIYSKTKSQQQLMVFLFEDILDRCFRLDFSTRELAVACDELFLHLVQEDLDSALALDEFIKCRSNELVLNRKRGAISLQVDGHHGGVLVSRRQVTLFNFEDAKSMFFLGVRDLLRCCSVRGMVSTSSLSFRFKDASREVVQSLNLGPVLFSQSRFTMCKRISAIDDHYESAIDDHYEEEMPRSKAKKP